MSVGMVTNPTRRSGMKFGHEMSHLVENASKSTMKVVTQEKMYLDVQLVNGW